MEELEKAIALLAVQSYSQMELAKKLARKRNIPIGNAQPIMSRYLNGQSRSKSTTQDLLDILNVRQVEIDLKKGKCTLR